MSMSKDSPYIYPNIGLRIIYKCVCVCVFVCVLFKSLYTFVICTPVNIYVMINQ